MTERNTDNVGGAGDNSAGNAGVGKASDNGANGKAGGGDTDVRSVRERIAANERARDYMEIRGRTGNAVLDRMAKNSQTRRALRGKIDEIVGRQEASDRAVEVSRVSGAKSGAGAQAEGKIERAEKPVEVKIDAPRARKPRAKKRALIFGGVGVALAVVVAVIVGVVIANNNQQSSCDTGGDYGSEEEELAILIGARCESIRDEYVAGNLSLDETIEQLEQNIEMTQGTERVFFALCYASFVYEETRDAVAASLVLDGVNDAIEGTDTYVKVNYYALYRYFYEQSGNTEMAEYYDEIVGSYMVEGTMMGEGWDEDEEESEEEEGEESEE